MFSAINLEVAISAGKCRKNKFTFPNKIAQYEITQIVGGKITNQQPENALSVIFVQS